MNTSDKLSIIAIGISVISIIWNAFSYFKYDRKLKALEIEEKEIGIQKHKQEKEDEKKAVIKGEFIYQGEGKYYHFSLTNVGKCTARNVIINLPEEHITPISSIQTIDYLSINQSIIYRVKPTYTCDYVVNVEFQWDDDLGKCRHSIEHLAVPNIVKRVFV